jgi:hypothetical protein
MINSTNFPRHLVVFGLDYYTIILLSACLIIHSRVSQKFSDNKVSYIGFDRVFQALQNGIVPFSKFFWPKIFILVILSKVVILCTIGIFLSSHVTQKCSYNELWHIGSDRVFQALQNGIVPFSKCFWPKIFTRVTLSKTVILCTTYLYEL